MIKLFWYSDFLVPSGFGNVAEEILSRLLKTKRYDITVQGIGHDGEPYNVPTSPYYRFRNIPVYPAAGNGDMFGRGKLIELLRKVSPDVLFILQDPFNIVPMHDALMRAKREMKFKIVVYFPVDGDLNKLWVTNGIELADEPVAYTQFGLNKVGKISPGLQMRVIHHGVDTNVFKPMSASERRRYRFDAWGVQPEDFVITNVNRNMPRKDLPRSILAWMEVKKHISRAKLYLHASVEDPAGPPLFDMIERYVPDKWQDDVMLPHPRLSYGVSKETMRKIYASSDVVISTSLGEGWGLSTTEAMACKVPVVMPYNSANIEIVGVEERGLFARCKEPVVIEHDFCRVRYLTDVKSLARNVVKTYRDKAAANKRVEVAHKWVKKNCDWDKIAEQWDMLFRGLT